MKLILMAFWMVTSALLLSLLAHAAPSDAGAAPAPMPLVSDAGPPPSGYLPDPAPLVTRHQWVVDLGYRSGAVVFGGARRLELTKATGTSRAMGRFALELFVGKELIDRVRFDFPLLGADDFADTPRRWDSPPSFERLLSTRAAIMLPHSERATRAVLVDRATGNIWALPWPFTAGADAGTSKGG
ncbi:MAG TPA: hypothetical protein VK550_36325 [Polyangiaceae bacterium]|jgi:hypothetical protein|nr:hypothetical protein [Polyangiaceae bacterium]